MEMLDDLNLLVFIPEESSVKQKAGETGKLEK